MLANSAMADWCRPPFKSSAWDQYHTHYEKRLLVRRRSVPGQVSSPASETWCMVMDAFEVGTLHSILMLTIRQRICHGNALFTSTTLGAYAVLAANKSGTDDSQQGLWRP